MACATLRYQTNTTFITNKQSKNYHPVHPLILVILILTNTTFITNKQSKNYHPVHPLILVIL
ncbi:hypothetical protein VB638_11170, partial [Dolichospermum sp. UHCC 0684]|uniref:hypothetical protein n=1 Tax=Dolichospermum sp. UHCC 0684 TaxID=3110242 RepID=UPI002B2143FD